MVDLYGIHGSVNIPYVLIVWDSVWVNTNKTSRGDFLRQGYAQYGQGDVRMSQWVYYAVGCGRGSHIIPKTNMTVNNTRNFVYLR